MWEIPPSSVTAYVPFTSFSRNKSSSENSYNTFGSISHDGTWSWVTQGSVLDVYTVQTRERCSFYNFGAKLKNPMPIVAVQEFISAHIPFPCLLVAINMTADGSILCVFNVKTSKITSAIQLPYTVTSFEVVSNFGGATVETELLNKQLRCLFGIVAVGTEGGNVLLLDLRLDADDYSDEVVPNQASIINKTLHNLPAKREIASTKSQHICIYLNDSNYHSDSFEYRNNNTLLAKFSSGDVVVSSLKYIRSLMSLVVGFNFGGIQLWNLQHLTLDISIPVHSTQQPLVHFAFQEPENDPRNFCYLWAVRGHHQGEHFNRPESTSLATLYSFTYIKKKWVPQYGNLYQDLESCTKRFEFALKEDPYNSADECLADCSRLITCQVISQADLSTLSSGDQLQNDEWGTSEDLGICLLSWENWSRKSGNCPESSSIALFDINQWYQAQMPSVVRCNYGEMCSYLGVFSLTEVTRKTNFDSFLDLSLVANSLSKFNSLSTAEEIFFPSSLSFETWCLSSNGTVKASYLGIQRQLLSEMNVAGPNILVNPKELFSCCLSRGLLNHLTGSVSSKRQMSVTRQREMLLTLALEHNMIQFLNSCVQSWKHAEFSHTGCTSVFLLEWVWKKISQIKISFDKLCQPLFDCSGQELDEKSLRTLHVYKSRLKYLSAMISTFQKYSLSESHTDLNLRKEVVDAISVYLHVLTWLHTCKLLPEHIEGEEYGEDEVAYPVTLLSRSYSYFRQELQKIHSAVGVSDVLLIDGLVAEFDKSLLQMWEDKGGSVCYPPPSIYAAVSSYLIRDTPLSLKHMLMYYLILDLSAFLSDRQSHLVVKLSRFCTSHSISSSLSRLTQALWCLDHRDFEAAVSMLLHPLILNSDIAPWQHQRIIKSLLYQDHPQLALKYINVRKPQETTLEAVKLRLSVLLANGLIGDALFFIRQHQNDRSFQDLLTHLFLGCQQTLCLESLFQLPLNSLESSAMTNYFYSCTDPKVRELLVIYYLLKCRPLEAAALNEKLTNQERDSRSRERVIIRNALVEGFVDCLPEEQKRLASELSHMCSQPTLNRVNPAPLSTNITSRSLTCMSYADVLQNVLDKCSNMISETQTEPFTPFRSWKRSISTTPFVRPTITPESRKRQRSSAVDTSPKDDCDFATPVKRARGFDMQSFNLNKADDHRNTRSSMNETLLSLLQTPPISRTPSRIRSSVVESSVPEVVSILKRRDITQRLFTSTDVSFPNTPSVCSEMSKDNDSNEYQSVENVEVEDIEIEEVEIKEAEDSGREKDFIPSKLRFHEPSPEKSALHHVPKVTPRRPLHEVFATLKNPEIHNTFVPDYNETLKRDIVPSQVPKTEELKSDSEIDVENFTLHYSDSESGSRQTADSDDEVMIDVADQSVENDMNEYATPEASFSHHYDEDRERNKSSSTVICNEDSVEVLEVDGVLEIPQAVPTDFLLENSQSADEDSPIVDVVLLEPAEDVEKKLSNSNPVQSTLRSESPSSFVPMAVVSKPNTVSDSNSQNVVMEDEIVPSLEEASRPVTPPVVVKEDSSNKSPYLYTRSRSRSSSASPSRPKEEKTSPKSAHVPRSVALFTTTPQPELNVAQGVPDDNMIPLLEAELPHPSSTPEKKQVSKSESLSPYLGTRSKSQSPSPVKINPLKLSESIKMIDQSKQLEELMEQEAVVMEIQEESSVEHARTITEIKSSIPSSEEIKNNDKKLVMSPMPEIGRRLTRLRKEKLGLQDVNTEAVPVLSKTQTSPKKVTESVGKISTAEKPVDKISTADKPVENISATKKPVEKVSTVKKQVENISIVEKQDENITAQKQAEKVSTAEKHVEKISTAEKHSEKVSTTEKHVKKILTAEKPVGKIPTAVKQKSLKKNSKSVKSAQKVAFSFSDPSSKANSEILEALSASPDLPIKSFVFSPPSLRTRAQARRPLKSAPTVESPLAKTRLANPEDQQKDISLRTSARSSHQKKSTKVKKNVESSNSELLEDRIRLISPMATPAIQTEDTTSSSTVKHRMILRKTKKKSVKLF